MKFFPMLDELVDIFDDVFRKRRSQQAAIAESAVTKFGTTLAPRNNFVAMKECGSFFE